MNTENSRRKECSGRMSIQEQKSCETGNKQLKMKIIEVEDRVSQWLNAQPDEIIWNLNKSF